MIHQSFVEVSEAKARSKNYDPYSILIDAKKDTLNEMNAFDGIAKLYKFADRVKTFLTKLGCDHDPLSCLPNGNILPSHQYFAQISNINEINSLIVQIKNLMELGFELAPLNEALLPEECQVDPKNPISIEIKDRPFRVSTCISRVLKSNEIGMQFFYDKVRRLVSYEINAKLVNGLLDSSIEDILYTNRGDLVSALKKSFYPDTFDEVSNAEIRNNIRNAQNSDLNTLKIFFKGFF